MNTQQDDQGYKSYKEQNIDVSNLLKVLIKYKLFIFAFSLVTTLLSTYYVLALPNIHRTELLLIPSKQESIQNNNLSIFKFVGQSVSGNGISIDNERMLSKIKTRVFLYRYIQEKNLKPILFNNRWNYHKDGWNTEEPTDHEAYRKFSDMISIDSDDSTRPGVVVLSIKWENMKDLEKLASITNEIVESINIDSKENIISESEESILFLKREIEKTNAIELKRMLYELIKAETSKIMFANTRVDTVFKIIDPAITPYESESKPIILIIGFGFFIGIFFSSMLVVLFKD